ncbi:MAG: hypothetical protein LLG04_15400 [Parachlamydia sp.]|nr:hypothetical protein [Parachlamydia sp.]
MHVEPRRTPDSTPPRPPSSPEIRVMQQLTRDATIKKENAEFLAEIEMIIGASSQEPQKAVVQYDAMPPPKAEKKSVETTILKPSPPTSISPRRPVFFEQSPEEVLLSSKAKEFHGITTKPQPSAWGAALRLLGRAAAVSTSIVLIPIAYLSLTASTAIGKVINLGAGKQVIGRPLTEPPEGTQFDKMKARLLENSFRSDLDVMYHGIRAVGDPREDLAIIRATLLSIVKK